MSQPRNGRGESGQVAIASVGLGVGIIFLALILLAVGRVYLAQSELQQAADVAAAVVSQPRGDDPIAHATELAKANGARTVRFVMRDGERSVEVRGPAPRVMGMPVGGTLIVTARVREPATPTSGAGGGFYSGPLVPVDGAVSCPAVAAAYREMQQAAAGSGVRLWAVSGWRSYAEQAVLYAQLGPAIAAPPGTSLHHAGTEFDLAVGPAGSTIHNWLTANAPAFGFIQRYSWEPWHWGYVRGCPGVPVHSDRAAEPISRPPIAVGHGG